MDSVIFTCRAYGLHSPLQNDGINIEFRFAANHHQMHFLRQFIRQVRFCWLIIFVIFLVYHDYIFQPENQYFYINNQLRCSKFNFTSIVAILIICANDGRYYVILGRIYTTIETKLSKKCATNLLFGARFNL